MIEEACYIGTKIIKASPMDEIIFLREIKGQADGISCDEREKRNNEEAVGRCGYLVIYPDGYKSWSPKDTFEEAYRPLSGNEKNLIKE